MRTRTRKMLSLLLATAMVFTLNTSVWAVEIGDDEATVDAIVTNEEVAADDVAQVAEDKKDEEKETGLSKLAKHGWTAATQVEKSDVIYDEEDKELTLERESNSYVKSLIGDTDTSQDLTIEYDADTTGLSENALYGFKVNCGKDIAGQVVVTLISNNEIASNNGCGYSYLGINAPTEKDQNIAINKDADVETWAKAGCGEYVDVKVDMTNAKDSKEGKGDGKIVCTFFYNAAGYEEDNKPYGEVTKDVGGAKFTYNENIPYFGKKLDKAGFAAILGAVGISSNNTKYTVDKVTLKIQKGTNTAIIKSIKLSGGDKKTAKQIAKSIKQAKITLKIYPYNLDNGVPENGKLKGKSTLKFTGKIPGGGKFALKDGKSDKVGGTAKLTKTNGGLMVSGNAMRGTISLNKITDKSK